MRFLVVVVVMVMVPVVAAAQEAPPSKVLERAIKLYDKEDYYSATIELSKVQSGETGDGPAHVNRAEFFQVKALYKLGFLVPSLGRLAAMEADPTNVYREAALKWIVAILRELPAAASGGLELVGRYDPGDPAVAQLGAVRDEYLVLRGRHELARGDLDAAAATLGEVAPGSEHAPAALLTLGEVWFRASEVMRAVDALATAAEDPAHALRAVHDLVWWTRMIGQSDAAAEALRRIAEGGGPGASAAVFARSRLAHEVHAVRGLTDTFDAVALVAVCGGSGNDDVLAAMKPLARQAAVELERLRAPDDDTQLFEIARARLTSDEPVGHVIRLALGLAEPLRWQGAIARERELLATADAAWRTTRIAADIDAELAIYDALAAADAGKWLRDRFRLIWEELGRFETAEGTFGLDVPPTLCQAAGLPATSSPVAEPERNPLPVQVKGNGCAGCASSSGGGFGAVVLVLVLARRRRRDAVRGDN